MLAQEEQIITNFNFGLATIALYISTSFRQKAKNFKLLILYHIARLDY
jgi:hypothetical protein